jgi:hypothetical protein
MIIDTFMVGQRAINVERLAVESVCLAKLLMAFEM